MGNYTSCSSSHLSPPVIPPSLAAKVLLDNGSVLHFTHPVKAIDVLLNHPKHFLCPSHDLLPLGNFVPAVLPDEELQLGQSYLLLPFETFQSETPATAFRHTFTRLIGTSGFAHDYKRRRKRGVVVSSGDGKRYQRSSKSFNVRISSFDLCRDISGDDLQENRHFETPDLRRVNKKPSPRRCRSWRPRLQAINESSTLLRV